MGALRKPANPPVESGVYERYAEPLGRLPAPEAFDYRGDITPEAVEQLQEKADRILEKEDWVVIEGYVHKKA